MKSNNSISEEMSKTSLKVSVSDSESSSIDDSEESDHELEIKDDEVEREDESITSGSNETDSDSELLMTNEGWADSVAKILAASKPKNKKTLVLSRAKKYTETVKRVSQEKAAFEVIGDGEVKVEQTEVEEEPASTEPPEKKKKHEKPSIRMKPNILEKDRERLLAKIATKGVVQLFNAVRNQQKTLDKEMDRKDISEAKKEKLLKKFDKRTFLDTLMGQTKSVVVDEAKTLKNEVKDEDKPRWNALRDDFMMGAKMKDWDKESVDE